MLPDIVYLVMNHQENQDNERRLQELELELEKEPLPSIDTQTGQPIQPMSNRSQQLTTVFNQLANWFNNLPSAAKVAVMIIAALLGFSILRSVLQLLASLISLAILGVILYLVYKFFVTSQSLK